MMREYTHIATSTCLAMLCWLGACASTTSQSSKSSASPTAAHSEPIRDQARTDAHLPSTRPDAPHPPASASATQAPPPPSTPESSTTLALKEIFPGIRVDVDRRIVEFDGEIAIDAHNSHTPRVYIEVLVCSPDSREHEAIVVTRAKPSLVHAALLAAGFKEGEPGSWTWDEASKALNALPPSGDPVHIDLMIDGTTRNLTDFVTRADTNHSLTDDALTSTPPASFVFAGSTLRTRAGVERYEADGAGTLIGLTTFGTETIAWSRLYSPDSGVEEPVWIAAAARVPAQGTKVAIRISSLASAPGK